MTDVHLEVQILDERVVMSLGEICHVCGVHAELVVEMVDEGILEPVVRRAGRWQFDGTGVVRLQTALRLQRDLGVNLAGAALALDLLDEIHRLRRHR